MDWIGLVGGAAGIASAVFSWFEWRKVNRKIAMLTDASKAAEILPAWYTSRMMTDDWLFGLLTNDGRLIAITRILAVSDDGQWVDVNLAEAVDVQNLAPAFDRVVHAVAADRTDASIQIRNIVAAFDLRTS